MTFEEQAAVPDRLEEKRGPGPYGFWATIGLGVLIGIGTLLLSVLGSLGIFYGWHAATTGSPPPLGAIESDPLFLVISTSLQALCVVAAVWLAVRLRGINLTEYVGLRLPATGRTLGWLAGSLFLVVVLDLFTWAIGEEIIPPWMREVYNAAPNHMLLVLALVVAAPLWEEVFFRGFLFEGVARSRLGGPGAIILATVSWASLHGQYNLHGVLMVTMLGLFLGVVKMKTGSTGLCILLHAFNNAIALFETAFFVEFEIG